MKFSLHGSLHDFSSLLREKPLSTLSLIVVILALLYSGVTLIQGERYVGALNNVDATTLVMAGFLWLKGFYALRYRNDLQTFSIALIAVLSFIFAYEAVYKASFYNLPYQNATAVTFSMRGTNVSATFGADQGFFGIPPAELREGIIEIAVALTILVGFSYGILSFSRYSKLFLVIFIVSWAFWLMVGFPQIFDLRPYRPPIINLQLNGAEVYIINRETKFALFLTYFFLFKPQSSYEAADREA